MNKKISKLKRKLVNNLFITLPKVKKLDTDKNIFNLDKPISQLYYSPHKDFWFAEGEKENKYVFIFGLKEGPIHSLNPNHPTFIIDIDKDAQFNSDSLGIMILKNSNLNILINNAILFERYSNINIYDFKQKRLKSNNGSLNINTSDLGMLDDDLIDNLEKIIKSAKPNKTTLEFIIKNPEVEKNDDRDLCKICGNEISKVKFNSQLKELESYSSGLCGKCVEKIVACEFYNDIFPLIKSNETKDLPIVREKYANDELFNLGMALMEKHKLIKYIGVKKLFFTFNKDSDLLKKYSKYCDKRKPSIDKLKTKSAKNPALTEYDNYFLNEENSKLNTKTLQKMNSFINELKSGKTIQEAIKASKISVKTVNNWYEFGKNGDERFYPFYKEYYPFKNKIQQEKMDNFLKVLDSDDFTTALKECNLDYETVKLWYDLGKTNNDYNSFRLGCDILLKDGFPEVEKLEDEVINKFINLVEKGLSNEAALDELGISQKEADEWILHEKERNEKYSKFYEYYHKNDKSKKESRTCRICGRKLNDKRKNDLCKRCEKKQYAATITLKLLKVLKPGNEFKKEDLKLLDLEEFQIQDYIWTLKEYNLITEKNNKYTLKDEEYLQNFITESGIEVKESDVNESESENKLYKTCKQCGETHLKNTGFFKSESSPDGFEDYCKDCKKLITAANYLNEIIAVADYESSFTQDDLKKYFSDPFKLQAKLWSLLDNDLITQKDEVYTLCDKTTAENFLDNYYKQEYESYYSKKEQMNIIINALNDSKSKEECGMLAKIPVYKFTHWYNEGLKGFGEDNIEFYSKVKDIFFDENLKREVKKSEEINKTPENRSEIPQIDETEFSENKSVVLNMNIILKNLTEGMVEEDAVEKSDISFETYKYWINRGKQSFGKIYSQFYSLVGEIKPAENQINNKKEEENQPSSNYEIDSDIYAPLPNKYESLFKSHKSSKIGIAWVNKMGNKWIYSKSSNGETIKITDEDIYKLYEKVKAQNQIWGIRDYKKASKYIDIPQDYIPETRNEQDILSMLPQEYNDSFRKKSSQTGIAWVTQAGNKFIYSRTVNGENIRITDEDIYKLYEKVKAQNQIWGIRDYDNAIKIIQPYENINKISTDEKPPSISQDVEITQPPITSKDVAVTYTANTGITKIIIKGIIKNTELLKILNRIESFENNIKRIITTATNDKTDLFIELEISDNLISEFENTIDDLKWKINKTN